MNERLIGTIIPGEEISKEYFDDKRSKNRLNLEPNDKIKVFISSICGKKKYDIIRMELKEKLESSKLAEVYLFEDTGASTLTAGNHYLFNLQDCDVCIFLIDNADEITEGVQREIDTVEKYGIKALYYFCDEFSKKKTTLEQKLIGADHAKCKIIHKFEELSQNGAQDLINEIISIYHYYCDGNLIVNPSFESSSIREIDISEIETTALFEMPKSILKNIEKCRTYLRSFILNQSCSRQSDEFVNSSAIDEWSVQFLQILFEGQSIRNFNTGMFMESLKEQQSEIYNQVVKERWQAIQAYFEDDIIKCVEFMEKALNTAKKHKQPRWMIKDILIDLRNLQVLLFTLNKGDSMLDAQRELTDSEDELHYPVLDRIKGTLYEKYVEEIYKSKMESPFTVTLGNNLYMYTDLITSLFVIAVYNGSLTHITMLYKDIENILIFLTDKYNNWSFKRDLLKISIFDGKEKDVKGILNMYPDILNNLDAEDALQIMNFCENHPVEFRKFNSQLIAMKEIGYFLSDEDFLKYEKIIIKKIEKWLDEKEPILGLGERIFSCLSGIAYRLSQETLANICCKFIERQYRRWYKDVFKCIGKYIDLNRMSETSSRALIEGIVSIIEDAESRKELQHEAGFLCVMRKQNRVATELLDRKIKAFLPKYYEGEYKLETTIDKNKDYPGFIQYYITRIKKRNEVQEENGLTFRVGTNDIEIIQHMISEDDYRCESAVLDNIIETMENTLLASNEIISEKLDAIAILTHIAVKYPEDFERNRKIYENLIEKQEEIEAGENPIISFNIKNISLKIYMQFLSIAMGEIPYLKILEYMPYLQGDTATTIPVTRIICEYLGLSEDIVLPEKIESVILQNTLQWIHADHLQIRWYATNIMLAMLRNEANIDLINKQLIHMIDDDNYYIKNLIMRNIKNTCGIYETTKAYIIAKCKSDPNFVVRLVCSEEFGNQDESEPDLENEE